jgi:hypothetical protein
MLGHVLVVWIVVSTFPGGLEGCNDISSPEKDAMEEQSPYLLQVQSPRL